MTTVVRNNYLTVNGVPLDCPAWWITNLTTEMLSAPAVRGQDRLIPGANGVRAYRRRKTVTVKQFQMVIVGYVDRDGGANANTHTGLITNVEYLTANLGIASTSVTAGTVTATWTRPNASTKSASVHVVRFETSDLVKRHAMAVLELSIPTGEFA